MLAEYIDFRAFAMNRGKAEIGADEFFGVTVKKSFCCRIDIAYAAILIHDNDRVGIFSNNPGVVGFTWPEIVSKNLSAE